MQVIIVGPCGSGKTTLVNRLQAHGYDARAVAQEHSAIHDLWKHGGLPAALIFLDASPAVISARRRNEFPVWLYDTQVARLADARHHATLYLHTDALAADEVQRLALAHLSERQVQPGDSAHRARKGDTSE